jgi:hypothetical protein
MKLTKNIHRALLPSCCLTALIACLTPTEAALTNLFTYNFPASNDGTTSDVILSVGGGSQNAIGEGNGGVPVLSADVPGVASATDRSVDFGIAPGLAATSFTTDATSLLNNIDILANGGFTMDIWFKQITDQADRTKIIDYAGTDGISMINGELDIRLNDTQAYLGDLHLNANDWNHVIYQFSSNSGDALSVDGTGTLIVNGNTIDMGPLTKNDFGDSLNRGIGIGDHPLLLDLNFDGFIFNPAVSLGVVVVPEPSSVVLIGLGGLSLLLRRRR